RAIAAGLSLAGCTNPMPPCFCDAMSLRNKGSDVTTGEVAGHLPIGVDMARCVDDRQLKQSGVDE
ncbi:MAG: hypothetical protein AAFP85_12980, partial [Pseudomonadota bacterium]